MRGSLSGGLELDRALTRLLKLATPEVGERALTAGAEVIADEARVLVHRISGELADSIGVSKQAAHYGPSAAAGTVGLAGGAVGSGAVTIFVGPAAPDGFYGHMEEFGTIHSPAHPFMRPAFDSKARQAEAAIAVVVRGEVKGATGG